MIRNHISNSYLKDQSKWLSGYDLLSTVVHLCENVIGMRASHEKKYGRDELNLLPIFYPTCTDDCICVEHK